MNKRKCHLKQEPEILLQYWSQWIFNALWSCGGIWLASAQGIACSGRDLVYGLLSGQEGEENCFSLFCSVASLDV